MNGKQRYGYVWISAVILVFGIIFVPKIVDRVRKGTVVDNQRMDVAQANGELAYIILDGQRRKVPAFSLIDQDSLPISDLDYKGKVYVAEFFFTSCPTICPIMTENLVSIQDQFGDRDDFGIASFSITPDYDTPSVLKAYADSHGVADLDWHLLTGDRDSIYDLANNGFNIYAAKVPGAPGGFEHSGLFALIDKQGFIRSRTDRFGNPIIYYRGSIPEAQGTDSNGETEQVGWLKEDIAKLLGE